MALVLSNIDTEVFERVRVLAQKILTEDHSEEEKKIVGIILTILKMESIDDLEKINQSVEKRKKELEI